MSNTTSADTSEFHCATHGRLTAGAILTTGRWHDCPNCDTHLFVPHNADEFDYRRAPENQPENLR
jgi:hypothetical protein